MMWPVLWCGWAALALIPRPCCSVFFRTLLVIGLTFWYMSWIAASGLFAGAWRWGFVCECVRTRISLCVRACVPRPGAIAASDVCYNTAITSQTFLDCPLSCTVPSYGPDYTVRCDVCYYSTCNQVRRLVPRRCWGFESIVCVRVIPGVVPAQQPALHRCRSGAGHPRCVPQPECVLVALLCCGL